VRRALWRASHSRPVPRARVRWPAQSAAAGLPQRRRE